MATNPSDAADFARRGIRSTVALAGWTAAWLATLALAAFGPERLWEDAPGLTAGAIGVNVLVGIGMLLANKRSLEAMDELQRATQLQVMAWTLGAGLVGGLAATLLARHGLIGLEVGVAQLVAFMGVVYLAGTFIGHLRYR